VSKTDPASLLQTQLRRAKAQRATSPAPEGDAELVFSFLLWEAPFTRARSAFKRLTDHVIDHNDLRVTYASDIAQILGKTYPLAHERAERLLFALETIYRREYAVTLEGAAAKGKREARKYLESIDDMPPFVSARVGLIAFGAHGAPVDERTLARLIESGVIEEGTTPEQASGALERAIKATDALEIHERVVDWLDKPGAAPGRKKTSKKTPATRKKTATKKAAKKTRNSRKR
jgi:hypothetical protein